MTFRPVLLCLLFLVALPARPAEPVRPPEWAVPVERMANLHRVTPTFYRSAKLGTADVARARTLGIKTVVSLRSFHSDNDVLKESGIKAIRVRINTWDIKDRHIVAALKAIRAAEMEGPVLLHCLHGADRTGLVTAMYRMLYQGWTKKQAMSELRDGGYGYHTIWTNIERYVRKVDIESIRAQVDRA